ncbi:MAG: hypothetical protein PUE17_00570 [Bacteroidales bacterium]|nr:hypothetical protein [Bacteroidales bacterium]MDD6731140.1 hypothetical protein [Bacteroidales bacterium]MDY4558789.1 hypothetical protein [Alloprevotella sp.]
MKNKPFFYARLLYGFVWLLGGLFCLLSEWNILPTAYLPTDATSVYVMQMLCVVLTIGGLPTALRLLQMPRVKAHTKSSNCKLAAWNSIRLGILCVPLFTDMIVYYGLAVTDTPLYCLLICAAGLVFCYPQRED